ncbi:tetratricopeptide repeat protein [Pseudomonadota bacterium]
MTSIITTEHLEELQSAIAALMERDTAKSLEILQGVLKANPESPEALHLLGLNSLLLGDLGRAIELITMAHEIDGECRDYVDALASLKTQADDLNGSLYFAKLATILEPHPRLTNLTPKNLQDYAGSLASANVPTHVLDATLSYARRLFQNAVTSCEKELRIKPNSVEALLILGKSLIEIGEPARAVIALQAAEQIAPGNPETSTALALALVMQGKEVDALACFAYSGAQDKDEPAPVAAQIHALSFMDDAHWGTRGAVEDTFLARAKAMGIEAMEGSDIPAEGKIRIAILSNALYSCDEALVLETFLENLNRNRFEVFCLQQSITHDKMTDRFKTLFDSWRPVFDLDDWVLASIISGDGIQALIDMNGYGAGQRRATLSAKPAPLQVAWLNHLDGTGKSSIDLVLSDDATADSDRTNAPDDQDVAKLECGLFAFQEFAFLDDVSPLPALEHDTITFGAYADLARVDAHTAMVWSQILKAVPNSLLVLNVMPNLPDDVRTALGERFAHYGMSKRIVFLADEPEQDGAVPTDPEQVFLAGVDVMLDTAVNASPGQIARALWMGVPVLTQDPGRRTGQVAASVLNAAGKGEWVAKTPDELIENARAMTESLQDLATLRKTLRDDIKDSALFQGRDFAREIETVIEMALEDRGVI